MRKMQGFSLVAAAVLIVSCFFPWSIVAEKMIVVSGIDATGTTYGKPGYLNLLMAVIYIPLTLVSRIWAKRMNLGVAAINLAWTFRNYILLSRCEAGICPELQFAFYSLMIATVAMMAGALLTGTDKRSN